MALEEQEVRAQSIHMRERSNSVNLQNKFLSWIFVSNVSKSMMAGSIIVSMSFSFIPPFHLSSSSAFDFCPIKILLCHSFDSSIKGNE